MNTQKKDLMTWLGSFCRKRRTEKHHFVLDGFDSEFCVVFDCEDVEEPDEYPATIGTCDILIEPLPHRSPDPIADRTCIVSNANKHGVIRFLAALGIRRFKKEVKTAFYELGGPLRGEQPEEPKEKTNFLIPAVFRPATGRIIPDLRKREHVCEFQSEIKAK